jgi:hypothetical protein
MSSIIFKPKINISEILAGSSVPPWLVDIVNIPNSIIKNQSILNMSSGLNVKNIQGFLFKTPKWGINGVYFDGILKTEHKSSVKLTQFPIQSGCMGTDHAVVEPASLSIDIMMSDANNIRNLNKSELLNTVIQYLKSLVKNSNYVEINSNLNGDGRSVNAWTILRGMQLARTPITVETRLHDYKNMIIEELSVPDDYKTYTALKCSVRLREIITVGVSDYTTSKRPLETMEKPANFGEVQGNKIVDFAKDAAEKGAKVLNILTDSNNSALVNVINLAQKANKYFQNFIK